jgi:hypothetical protein
MVEQLGDGPSDVEFYQLSSALVPRCGSKREKKGGSRCGVVVDDKLADVDVMRWYRLWMMAMSSTGMWRDTKLTRLT